jgi:predicted negative regulator of RcsB-dependent stress response
MKSLTLSAVLVIALAVAAPQMVAAGPDIVAKVQDVKGSVFLVTSDNKKSKITAGTEIPASSTVITGKGSKVLLVFGKDTMKMVGPNSRLRIQDSKSASSSRLGSLGNQVFSRKASENFSAKGGNRASDKTTEEKSSVGKFFRMGETVDPNSNPQILSIQKQLDRSNLFIEQGNYAAAVKEIEKAEPNYKNVDDRYRVKGAMLKSYAQYKGGDFLSALESLQTVLDKPSDENSKILAEYWVGSLKFELGVSGEAKDHLESVVKQTVAAKENYQILAATHLLLGKIAKEKNDKGTSEDNFMKAMEYSAANSPLHIEAKALYDGK